MDEEEIRLNIWLIIEEECSKLCTLCTPVLDTRRYTALIDWEKFLANLKCRIDKLLDDNKAVLVHVDKTKG